MPVERPASKEYSRGSTYAWSPSPVTLFCVSRGLSSLVRASGWGPPVCTRGVCLFIERARAGTHERTRVRVRWKQPWRATDLAWSGALLWFRRSK
jgi:hypothetical protein